MTTSNLADQLQVLGLSEQAVRVYVRLLKTGPVTPREVADMENARLAGIEDGLAELADAGLVGTTGEDGARVVPVSPETGLEILTLRRQSALHEARVAALNAFEVFRRAVYTESTGDLVEVVSGAGIHDRITQLVRGVQQQVRRLDSPPYYTPDHANPDELAQLAAGVEYRVVYAQASVQQPGYFEENILPCIEAGEQARVLSNVPVKLTIVDRTMALVSLAIAEAETNRSLVIVRPCSLFSALVGLFEVCWRTALPLHPGGSVGERRLKAMERRMLALLASGVADDAIARELGVSRRTFFRHLERLMTSVGATNRFQLALHASRNGWL